MKYSFIGYILKWMIFDCYFRSQIYVHLKVSLLLRSIERF